MDVKERKEIDDTFDAVYKDWVMSNPIVRQEGQIVNWSSSTASETQVQTTYIEFPLPIEWEEECWLMIDAWLEAKKKTTKINWVE